MNSLGMLYETTGGAKGYTLTLRVPDEFQSGATLDFSSLEAVPNDASAVYVSTNGDDTNNGAFNSPYRTIGKALTEASPGQCINMYAGVYLETPTVDKSITLNLIGSTVTGLSVTASAYVVGGNLGDVSIDASTLHADAESVGSVTLTNGALNAAITTYGGSYIEASSGSSIRGVIGPYAYGLTTNEQTVKHTKTLSYNPDGSVLQTVTQNVVTGEVIQKDYVWTAGGNIDTITTTNLTTGVTYTQTYAFDVDDNFEGIS